MAEIVQLSDHDPRRGPWYSGGALCLRCRHEWTAVWPADEEFIECPECGRFTGTRAGTVTPKGEVWHCNDCDNELFYVTPEGVFCPQCGNEWPKEEI